MRKPRDDWEKPRRTSDHFSEVEIAKLHLAFEAGKRAPDVARDMQCSSRVVYKWFSIFRGDHPPPAEKSRPKRTPKPFDAPAARASRFYHSTFELDQ